MQTGTDGDTSYLYHAVYYTKYSMMVWDVATGSCPVVMVTMRASLWRANNANCYTVCATGSVLFVNTPV